MRTLTYMLVASLLGASSLAFAAAPAPTNTREARMESALKNYRAGKVTPPKSASTGAPMVKKPHAGGKTRAVKKAHTGKHHARGAGRTGATVKAAPVAGR